MDGLPQHKEGYGSYISVGVDGSLSPQILVGGKSGSVLNPQLRHSLGYKAEADPLFVETLKLCDKVFYPLRDRFLVKLWKKAFGSIYKVDYERGIIAFDIPTTSYHNRMRYSRIVIIPRGFILNAKELQALWIAAKSLEKPIDGDLDSMTVAIFTLKAGEELPGYHFERLGKRSKAEFMAFIGLPARTMAKFLEILIQFFEKRLRAFLRRFDIPVYGLAYSLRGRGSYIRTKKPRTDLRSFWKWRPSRVDYIKNVKSGWLRSALKGLMNLINELIDAYTKTVKPLMKFQLGLRSLRKALPQIIAQFFGNLRFTPEQIRHIFEMVLSEDFRPQPPDIPLKLYGSRVSHEKTTLAPSEGVEK